jgi:UDP-N-acetyl-2-amino-2-deoxyglucuronate dehydrogenase
VALRLGFIGCGGISRAHFDGLVELRRAGQHRFDLRAVCDVDASRAEALADRAAEALGTRPQVYDDYRALLDRGGVDAVSVMVQHHLHHVIARDAFAGGAHVQMQKPIAISPTYARQMIDDAARHQRVLTVAEPAILGAGAVALARAVAGGLTGDLYYVVDFATASTKGTFFGGTPWRHMNGYAGGGWIMDHGLHRGSHFLTIGGAIDEVFACAQLFEPVRRDPRSGFEQRTTGEDAALTVFRFAGDSSGGRVRVLGHWMCATAAHGEGAHGLWYHGSRGVAQPREYVKLDDGSTIPWDDLITRYAPDVVRGAFAHSYLELADAIERGAAPISSAARGAEALGVVYAALEASTVGRPVKVADVLEGRAHAYEDSVIKEMQALAGRDTAEPDATTSLAESAATDVTLGAA